MPRAAAEKLHSEHHGVTLYSVVGAVLRKATHEPPPAQASVVEPAAAVVLGSVDLDATEELNRLARAIAETEGRLAGLRFRQAEVRAE